MSLEMSKLYYVSVPGYVYHQVTFSIVVTISVIISLLIDHCHKIGILQL